jgi:hypothetical protein
MTDTTRPQGHDGRRYCGAKKRQPPYGPCTQPAGWGTDHVGHGRCKLHGGRTPTVAKGAAESALEEQARTELAKLDVRPVENPLTELQLLAGQAVAWKNTVAGLVNRLGSLRYEGESGEQLRAEVGLWERALDRCEKVLTAMARLDIDERLVKISEHQGKLVTAAIMAAFVDIGLSHEMQQALRPAIARHLRLAALEERERERPALEPR